MQSVVPWLSQNYSVLSLESKKRKSRFSLLQLEHGELFLYDYGVTLINGSASAQAGRLKCCSRSLVFEPSEARLPLLKLCLRLLDDVPVAIKRQPDRILVACESVLEMESGGVAPWSSRSTTRSGGGSKYFEFAPLHSPVSELQRTTEALRRAALAAKHDGASAEAAALSPLVAPLTEAKFEMRQLVDFREDIVAQCMAERITPLLRQPGVMVVTTQRIYFEPAALNNVGDTLVSVSFAQIASCRRGRHMMQRTALELQLLPSRRSKDCLRLAFENVRARDTVWTAIASKLRGRCLSDDAELVARATRDWQARRLDNFSYLCVLNHLADRSLHDISQYPVMPWVVADYDSPRLELDKPATFRDLSKPIGALEPKRLASFLERYEAMAAPPTRFDEPLPPPQKESPLASSDALRRRTSFSKASNDVALGASRVRSFVAERILGRTMHNVEQPTTITVSDEPPIMEARDAPFIYGTHYSTPGYIAFYLVRAAPEYTLCLQNGRFDAPDRMFTSLPNAWRSVASNSTDLKELIPEFYEGDGTFLTNARNVPLGTTQSGEKLGDVKLPRWARSPADLVRKLRQALESDHVSARLHLWIDLIFGYKQRGEDAAQAHNLFHPLTYEGAVELDELNSRDRVAVETQIDEFGQTPTQLFVLPHPPRDAAKAQEPQHRPSRDTANVVKKHAVVSPPPDGANTRPLQLASPLEQHGVSPLNASKLLATRLPEAKPEPPPPPPAQKPPAELPPPVQSRQPPTVTEQPPSERRAVPAPTTGRRRPAARVVGVEAAGPATRLHRDAISDAACAHGVVASVSRDGALKVCAFRSGGSFLVPRRTITASKPLSCVCLADSAKLAITGGLDASLSIYAIDSGAAVTQLEDAHDAGLACACAAGRIDEVATGALDASVKLWRLTPDASCRDVVAFYDHESPVSCCAASARLVAAGAEDGRVLVWDARDDASAGPLGHAVLPDAVAAISFEHASSSLLAVSRSGHLARLSLDGRHLENHRISANVACLAVLDARPDALNRDRNKLAGPYALAGTRAGELLAIHLPSHTQPSYLKRLPRAHGAPITVVRPVFDDHPTDPLESFLLSAAEDCTLRAWTVVRADLEV